MTVKTDTPVRSLNLQHVELVLL